jgi:hypothetical protein
MKKLIIILAILLISAPCFAWSDSEDNPKENIQSSYSDKMQQSTKKADLNGAKEGLNKETGNYIGNYLLAKLTKEGCKASCKNLYNSCKDTCSFSNSSPQSHIDICMDGCIRDYDWCIEDCYSD